MLRPFCICWCWLGLCCSSLPVSFTGFRLAGRATHQPASARRQRVRASSVSRGRAGQTESGTRKGTWVVEACVVRRCQRVSRGSVWSEEPRISTPGHAGNGSGHAVSREGRRAKRNPGLARARGLLRPALFVAASEFHGVPFGLVPAGFFRYDLGLVMVWLFRCCKRPNGMEVGFSLLSLWLVVGPS